MEPQKVFESHVQHQEEQSGFDIYSDFLDSVRNGTKEEVIKHLSLIKSSTDTAKRATEADEDNTSNPLPTELTSHRQKLLKALERKDVGDVWKLIVEGKEDDIKTLENLNKVCQSVAENEHLKEAGLFKSLWGKLRSQLNYTGGFKSCSNCCHDEQPPAEFQNQEEQEWIKILTNPLYIGLEWLWRNNRKGETATTARDERRAKESKLQDVIEASLHDAHLLEKIASYKHHYSRDEYTKRAEEYEKFAADVVEESSLEQLHVVMDVEGTGCLLQERPEDFNQSLSLLKIAADKQRKRVCVQFYFMISDLLTIANKTLWEKESGFVFSIVL